MRVSGNGSTPEPVLSSQALNYYAPQLLQGGDAVLFNLSFAQVAVQLLHADEPQALFPGAAARFLPTGHIVYYVDGSLYAQVFDLANLEVVGGSVPVVEGVMATRFPQFAVSDSGTLTYFPEEGGGSLVRALVWVGSDGVAEPIETIPTGHYGNPRLSPNGERILSAADDDLWIYDIASGRRTAITIDGMTSPSYYAWSPDGSLVAYTSTRSGPAEAWVQLADGSGEPVQLTRLEGGSVDVDSWAPDGEVLAIHHHTSGGTDILMLPLGEAEPAPATFLATENFEDMTQLSPDGRFVAYVSDRSGESRVYIRPYPGPGAPEIVSIDGGVEPI